MKVTPPPILKETRGAFYAPHKLKVTNDKNKLYLFLVIEKLAVTIGKVNGGGVRLETG